MLRRFTTGAARLRRDEAGASMPEYALLVGLIGAAAIVAVAAFGSAVMGMFDDLASALENVAISAGVGLVSAIAGL